MKRSTKSFATEIYTQYEITKESKTYLIVEGESDLNLWKDNFAHEDVIIKVSGDKDVSIETLKILYQELSKKFSVIGIIAIVDSDFDHLKKTIFKHKSLFRTDFHDIGIMMLKSKAFIKFFNRHCTERERIKHHLKKVYKTKINNDEMINRLREYLFDNAKIIGILRWINELKNLNLNFKKINYYNFIKKNSLEIDIEKLINHLITINSKNSKLKSNLIKELDNELKSFNKGLICQICQGHDTISILTVGVNIFLSKRKKDCRMPSMDLHKFFEVSFELYHLKEFKLYEKLRKWEENYIPFKIFRD